MIIILNVKTKNAVIVRLVKLVVLEVIKKKMMMNPPPLKAPTWRSQSTTMSKLLTKHQLQLLQKKQQTQVS